MSEQQAFAVRPHEQDMSLEVLGKTFVASGYFKDVKSAQQSIVKVLAGRELGIGPFSSQTALHIIEGKPVLSANLLAAAVKRSGKYTYRVESLTDDGCRLGFYERSGDKWEKIGVSEFSKAEATAAGLTGKDNWRKNVKAMYFARAISQGQRWHAPDIFQTAVYTPDEMDMKVNADGDAVDVHVVEPTPPPAAPADKRTAEQKHLDALKKKLWAFAKSVGVSHEQLKNYSVETLGKASSNEWRAEDCDGLLLYVEDIAAAKQKQVVA